MTAKHWLVGLSAAAVILVVLSLVQDISTTFYLTQPVTEGIRCLAIAQPTQVGWPQPAVTMVLNSICGSGAWIEVHWEWFILEGLALAGLAGGIVWLSRDQARRRRPAQRRG